MFYLEICVFVLWDVMSLCYLLCDNYVLRIMKVCIIIMSWLNYFVIIRVFDRYFIVFIFLGVVCLVITPIMYMCNDKKVYMYK